MRRVVPLLLILPSAGCGATDPLVVVPESCRDEVLVGGMLLAAEASDPDVRDPLEAVAFLAQWTLSGEHRDAIVTDGTVAITAGEVELPLPHAGDGVYSAEDEDPALYAPGTRYTLAVGSPLGGGSMTVVAPDDAAFTLPEPATHSARESLDVDLAGQGFDIARGTVVDDAGERTWRSLDNNVWRHHAWLRGDGPVSAVTVDGEAFPAADATYHVGLAGLVRAAPEAFAGLAPECSAFAVGRMVVGTVRTAP